MPVADLLKEQLWGPALQDDAVRIVVGGGAPDGWRVAESYWMVPNAQRANLLLPDAPRRVTAASATNYSGMRRPLRNVGRNVLGYTARVLGRVPGTRLTVQVRESRPDLEAGLPLQTLSAGLGVAPVHAALGVRRGANRKATLHLLDETGSPVGYAKFGWSETTDGWVSTEGSTLREVGGRPGAMRAPRLLAEVDYHGHPVIVTEPLPLDLRGARSQHAAAPTPGELYALCPVVRRSRIADTAHFQGLVSRLRALGAFPVTAAVVERSLPLVEALAGVPEELPVTERWHGDLTPWNRARDRAGQLWVWDWESSERDAVAGLDAFHWHVSVARPVSGRAVTVDLAAGMEGAAEHLRAAGVARAQWADVAAVYALTVVERAADLARRSGGWTLWVDEGQITAMLEQVTAMRHASSSTAP